MMNDNLQLPFPTPFTIPMNLNEVERQEVTSIFSLPETDKERIMLQGKVYDLEAKLHDLKVLLSKTQEESTRAKDYILLAILTGKHGPEKKKGTLYLMAQQKDGKYIVEEDSWYDRNSLELLNMSFLQYMGSLNNYLNTSYCKLGGTVDGQTTIVVDKCLGSPELGQYTFTWPTRQTQQIWKQ